MTDAFEKITVGVDGPLGALTLNEPQRLNPLGVEMLTDLVQAASWFDDQEHVKVVVVRGAGRAFTAGADVRQFRDAAGGPQARAAADLGRAMADAIESMQAVTIAQIHGHCVGGGVVLAAACDLRVAADDVRFAIPEVDLGIPLAWGGIPRLVREIGPARAKELVMTCRPFTAAEARETGFVNAVFPEAALERAVQDLATTLTAKPRFPLLATKRHVNAVTGQMVGTDRSWSDADGFVTAMGDAEGRAAAAAYLESLGQS